MYNNVNILVIQQSTWGSKKDPTEYDSQSNAIRIRKDYKDHMTKDPFTHHWIYHEFAHHMLFVHFGQPYINATTGLYPDNRIERFAFAYQFYYLMSTKTCKTIDDLFLDPYFSHKKIYSKTLAYYWNNAHFIIGEFQKSIPNQH